VSRQHGARSGVNFAEQRGFVPGTVQSEFDTADTSEKTGNAVVADWRRMW